MSDRNGSSSGCSICGSSRLASACASRCLFISISLILFWQMGHATRPSSICISLHQVERAKPLDLPGWKSRSLTSSGVFCSSCLLWHRWTGLGDGRLRDLVFLCVPFSTSSSCRILSLSFLLLFLCGKCCSVARRRSCPTRRILGLAA